MADAAAPEIYYRLTCSSLLVTGKRETKVNWETGAPEVTPTADVRLVVEAERRRIGLIPRLKGSNELTVKLASDGRLLSVSGTTRGLVGELLQASLGAVSFAAGIVGSVLAPRLPVPATISAPIAAARAPTPVAKDDEKTEEESSAPETPAQDWEQTNPDGDASRLASARATLGTLHAAVLTRAAEAATGESPAAAYRRLLAVKNAIKTVEAEVAAINIRREAWLQVHYPTGAEEFRHDLPTDEVFHVVGPDVPPTLRRSQLTDGSAGARAVLRDLAVAIVEVRAGSYPDRMDIDDAEDLATLDAKREGRPAVYFRVSRSALIALYRDAPDRDEGNPERLLTLVRAERYWVSDLDSRMGTIPLTGDGSLKASAAFTETGVLDSVSFIAEDKLEKLIAALKAAPEQVAAGLTQAKTAVETWGTLRSAAAQREIDLLEARKQQLELEVATRGLTADVAKTESLAQVKDRLERLRVEKEIASLTTPPTGDEVAAAARATLAQRLQVEVEIARAEHALAAFHDTEPH